MGGCDGTKARGDSTQASSNQDPQTMVVNTLGDRRELLRFAMPRPMDAERNWGKHRKVSGAAPRDHRSRSSTPYAEPL